MSAALTAVIIPTWNGRDLLRSALRGLEAQRQVDFEAIVVDNGSSDGTREMIETEFPRVRALYLGENRGFAAAVNAGVAATAAEVVVLLNNDAVPEPGWLPALLRVMDGDPAVGSCASRVLRQDDPSRLDSAGDGWGLLAWSRGHDEPDGPAFDAPADVLAASGSAAAYRRAAFEAVGGMDERFFAYLEDVDLGIRLRLAGWRCRYVPDARVLHRGSVTSDRIGGLKLKLLLRNSLRLVLQYAPPERLLALPALIGWVKVRSVREAGSLRPGLAAIAAVARELPLILQRRRRFLGGRRITMTEFRRSLDPVLTRSRRGAAPGGGAVRS
ncbi:MAG TPA: glycosyltransferase family 2 protein [Longimicrobiales bacterium]|nr:glycosyltransferase family 2 protein [Longimicrobiales bacterium]